MGGKPLKRPPIEVGQRRISGRNTAYTPSRPQFSGRPPNFRVRPSAISRISSVFSGSGRNSDLVICRLRGRNTAYAPSAILHNAAHFRIPTLAKRRLSALLRNSGNIGYLGKTPIMRTRNPNFGGMGYGIRETSDTWERRRLGALATPVSGGGGGGPCAICRHVIFIHLRRA